ncbi:MAG: hypothetical protein R8G60_09670 [Roseovarius pacificus]|nr:hypothetical protein [Roseovarius pacificus]
MKKDLRDREALKGAPELADVADSAAFPSVKVEDLRKLAELVRDYSGGSLAGISLESATAFGGTSRHRFQCAQRALRALVGMDHPATNTVSAALRNHGAANRKGSRHRDDRTREAILHEARWTPFREIDATRTMPLDELRALDRFLAFCETNGRGTETEDFLAFVSDRGPRCCCVRSAGAGKTPHPRAPRRYGRGTRARPERGGSLPAPKTGTDRR